MLQRVRWARVEVAGTRVAAIGPGLLALVGVAVDDAPEDAERLARKSVALRIFPDAADVRPFHRAIGERPDAALLCVSQFTLLADLRRGNRPSWAGAAPPERAAPLVEAYAAAVAARGVRVERGRFGADMRVSLQNDGPVTLVLDSREPAGGRRGAAGG